METPPENNGLRLVHKGSVETTRVRAEMPKI
jgi:hypothetical protein